MRKNPSILIISLLALLGAQTSAIGSDNKQKHSGRVESSHTKFYEDGSGKPNKFEFSTTDGNEFVMYSEQVLIATSGALIDIYLSPVQTEEKLLVCAYDIKSIRIISNGVESDLMFEEQQRYQTTLGHGCN